MGSLDVPGYSGLFPTTWQYASDNVIHHMLKELNFVQMLRLVVEHQHFQECDLSHFDLA